MKSGIVILDKGENITSFAAVRRVAKLFGAEKAGHTGTLDPMATGVLPILIGRAVKASGYLLSSEKHYGATLRLGMTTDTEDVTGKVLSVCQTPPDESEVYAAARRFEGEILQTPPMYSALKIGGRKLVDLARKGVEVEREARPVFVYSLAIRKINASDYDLDVRCSKGTYIRTLCADIGKALGVGGVMASLRRMEAGGFSLDEAYTLEAYEGMSEEEREGKIIPLDRVFSTCPKVVLPPFFAKLARAGQPIYQKKIGTAFPETQKIRLYEQDSFFALGEAFETEAGSVIKPIMQLEL